MALLDASSIPSLLTAIPHWVLWRWEQRSHAKTSELTWTKPPYQPNGNHAKSTEPATWVQFEEALAAYHGGGFDGIGFVLTREAGIVGVDLDHCVDPETGAIEPRARAIVDRVDSYTEVSPSGTGLRVFTIAKLPSPGRKRANVEMYDSGRYLTVTGHHLTGTPQEIKQRHAEINAIHGEIFSDARNGRSNQPLPPRPTVSIDDQVLLAKAMSAANGVKFATLWHGDITGYPSQSEADLALCSLLTFWSGRDPVRVERLFRQSGLFRSKWDERHGELTYGQMTVGKALSAVTEFYLWHSNDHRDASADAAGDEDAQIDYGEAPAHLTDLGNARRLVELHGHDLRYCHPWAKWLVWDGSRWRQDDTAEVYRRARRTIWEIYRQAAALLVESAKVADDDRRQMKAANAEALSKWARKSENRARIEAMIKLAESEAGVPVLPSQLDMDHWLLNCSNGTVDLKTGQLRGHCRDDLITKLAPVTYDASATCPVWDRFLEKIMAGNRGLILFLQKAIGYSLTGDVSEQVIFIFFGTGANGKSTFLGVTLRMLGDYAKKAPMDLFMAKPNETHPTEKTLLFGARFVAGIEAHEGKRLAEVFIKEATGGDPITARRMREDFWTFNPTHKVFLAVNHKPIIRGTDHAIWRRLKLVPFNVTIPKEAQDKRLPEKLYVELPGILTWAVKGCIDWQRNGLGEPQEVEDATSKYREDMDVLGDFIGERCLINPAVQVSIKDLYNAYVEWANESGEKVSSKVAFGQRLVERGFTKARGTNGAWCWSGIGLVADSQATG